MRPNLRIVSANIYNSHVDPVAFAAQMADIGADVVAVQELSHPAAEALSDVLPYGDLTPAPGAMGMGIALSRPAKLSRIPLRYRDARMASLETDDWPELDRPLDIINAHIAAPAFGREVFRIRSEQVADLEAYLDQAAPRPRILVGDLNSTPLWPAYRRLCRRFTDAAVQAARRHGRFPARTWGPMINGPRLLRIDHVLTADTDVSDVTVIRVRGSDHSALVVDIPVGRG